MSFQFKLDEFGFVDLLMDDGQEAVLVDSSVGVNTATFNPSESQAARVAGKIYIHTPFCL